MLQALEAIKLTVEKVDVTVKIATPAPTMLLFSGLSTTPFRTVRLRPKRPDCFACSAKAGLTLESLATGSMDYVAFCGSTTSSIVLSPEERVEAQEYAKLRESGRKHVLLDVRDKTQFDICHIEGSINIPFSKFQGNKESPKSVLPSDLAPDEPIYVVCRMGNDSQVVTKKLKEAISDAREVKDIKGGFSAWKKEVDSTWPEY